jgi:hypothetical protein
LNPVDTEVSLLPEQCPKRNQVYCFDVDDTLVMWGFGDRPAAVEFDNWAGKVMLVPHQKHVEQLKRHHEAGHFILVWSQGGYEWAKEVVTKLGLLPFVDQILAKPTGYYDDINAMTWMGRPHYYPAGEEIK